MAEKWYFWDLVPVLKVKIKFLFFKYSKFPSSTGTKPEKYHYSAFKIQKKFIWVFVPVKLPYFWHWRMGGYFWY
jgi:hypothetical protein